MNNYCIICAPIKVSLWSAEQVYESRKLLDWKLGRKMMMNLATMVNLAVLNHSDTCNNVLYLYVFS